MSLYFVARWNVDVPKACDGCGIELRLQCASGE